ncbi:MAG: hypothetical protein OEV93_00410 [Candidatus Moranbacteria bacterium]|nr:hypothetical protein [Candidatus Moranbacteria bacterium]
MEHRKMISVLAFVLLAMGVVYGLIVDNQKYHEIETTKTQSVSFVIPRNYTENPPKKTEVPKDVSRDIFDSIAKENTTISISISCDSNYYFFSECNAEYTLIIQDTPILRNVQSMHRPIPQNIEGITVGFDNPIIDTEKQQVVFSPAYYPSPIKMLLTGIFLGLALRISLRPRQ